MKLIPVYCDISEAISLPKFKSVLIPVPTAVPPCANLFRVL